MKKETTLLHHFLPKRGLSRIEAADYIGVGTSKFDEMVKDRRMPQPKRIDGRVIWDRREFDVAFDDLPSDGGTNPWDEVAA
jgi:predicted DNA-binding transcriptional regulator AlpA